MRVHMSVHMMHTLFLLLSFCRILRRKRRHAILFMIHDTHSFFLFITILLSSTRAKMPLFSWYTHTSVLFFFLKISLWSFGHHFPGFFGAHANMPFFFVVRWLQGPSQEPYRIVKPVQGLCFLFLYFCNRVDSGPIAGTLSNSHTCTKAKKTWFITFFFVSRWLPRHIVIVLDVVLITHFFHFVSFGLQ